MYQRKIACFLIIIGIVMLCTPVYAIDFSWIWKRPVPATITAKPTAFPTSGAVTAMPTTTSSGMDIVCNPWRNPDPKTRYITPASRYYATGGTARDHEYAGVDSYSLISILDPQPKWESTYRIDLYHTKDWVIYHVKTPLARNGTWSLYRIDICAKNPYTPRIGTPVEVFAKEDDATSPPHDSDLAAVGWQKVGEFTILTPGDWNIYTINLSTRLYSPQSFTIGLSLKDGEIGPEDPSTPFREDKNLYLAWISINAD
jgi:hypothetical protein